MKMTELSITTQVTAPSASIQTFDQLGGQGIVYNHCLVVPGHLQQYGSPIRSLEFVTMAPTRNPGQATMIGTHRQTTDEIYFFVYGGKGLLSTNGQDELVFPADLVIAPSGTYHSLRNMSDTALGFLVVEVEAMASGCDPLVLHTLRHALQTSTEPTMTSSVNLKDYFSEYWGELSLIKLPAGGRMVSCEDDYDQNLFVVTGNATLLIHDHTGDEVVRENSEGFGLNAFLPRGLKKTLINRSIRDPLVVLTLNILPGAMKHA